MLNWLNRKFEISHGNHRALLSMEGMRGLAVFLVFWVHYSSLIEPWVSSSTLPILHFIHSFGHLGVDLFFVLSGYLIYGSVLNKKVFSVKRYTWRRMERIYPTFLVVFIVYVVLSYLFPTENKIPTDSLQAFIYIVQNLLLLPGLFKIEPIITVAWSLSYEVFYYIVIPIIIFALRLSRRSIKYRIILWVLVAIMGFILHLLFEGPVRLLMFISGILLFELTVNKDNREIFRGEFCLFGLLLLFGASYFIEINSTFLTAAAFIMLMCFCLSAFDLRSNLHSWLIFTPLRWLGNMSYSYYLLHGLTLKFAFLVFALMVPDHYLSNVIYYWLWIPLFVMTLLTSSCLFLLIERPFSLAIRHK